MHFSAIQPGASKAPRRGGLSANSRLADGLGASAGLGLWVLGLGASTSQTKHVWNLKHHTHTQIWHCVEALSHSIVYGSEYFLRV